MNLQFHFQQRHWDTAILLFALAVSLVSTSLEIVTRGVWGWWYQMGNVSIALPVAVAQSLYRRWLAERYRLPRHILFLLGLGVACLMLVHLGTWQMEFGLGADRTQQALVVLMDMTLAIFMLLHSLMLYRSPEQHAT